MSEDLVQFVPFSSCVDPSFWHKLSQLKLDVYKLGEEKREIWGYFNNVAPRGLNRILYVDCSSFNTTPDEAGVVCVGSILNKNTVEGFKEIDKELLLVEEGRRLVDVIKSSALDNPKLLSRFTIISFADLKKHKFTYWFAFPALNIVTARFTLAPCYAEEIFSPDELQNVVQVAKGRDYFVLNGLKNAFKAYDLKEGFAAMKNEPGDWMLVFADSCSNDENPGWPLRNFLALYAYHCADLLKKPIQVLCLRLRTEGGEWFAGKSLFLHLLLSVAENAWDKENCCVGWEKNDKGKFGPRLTDLNSSMNPNVLAEFAADLNLKLMSWQVFPDLNLELIKSKKCLLLGAGTLGCAVARSLLAWGIRQVTFVDSSSVSYSNPVRQSLYKFSDIGKPKAQAAAAALKEILPAVESQGHQLTIPMPGHPFGGSLVEEIMASLRTLEELIASHHVIFLLMDSRESRWLPTLIAAAKNKVVINAALGFDSFLVMRHGVKDAKSSSDSANAISGNRLGCYFCNDVTAPGNSQAARTLDQQCTVTRPAVAQIAGSLAVELLIGVLQHPDGPGAPAYTVPQQDEDILPHSIRGFLGKYEMILPAVEAFSSCVACSSKVVAEYQANGLSFICGVLQSTINLEKLTGLTDLHSDSILDGVEEIPSSEEE